MVNIVSRCCRLLKDILPVVLVAIFLGGNIFPTLQSIVYDWPRVALAFPGWSIHKAAVVQGQPNIQALPGPAQIAVKLLRKHEVKKYALSSEWFAPDKAELLQRVAEGAWPARGRQDGIKPRTRFVLTLGPEPSNCVLVEKEESVGLYRCR